MQRNEKSGLHKKVVGLTKYERKIMINLAYDIKSKIKSSVNGLGTTKKEYVEEYGN